MDDPIDELRRAADLSASDRLIGRVAVREGLITESQLSEALREQQAGGGPLGAVFVKRRWITADQLADLLGRAADRGQPSLIGRYQVRGLIGRGGMGIVYRGFDPATRREVALKVLPEERLSGPLMARFAQEARAIAKLSHPNIVTLYEADLEHAPPYLALELVEGVTLEERQQKGRMTVRSVVTLMQRVATGVAHAHAHGIVHRDLKPSNILLARDGEPKVTDFGLVRFDHTTATPLTQTGTLLGTVHYMAPEQVRGEKIDARVDVWAMGVMLYELLSGGLPFDGETAQAIFRKILEVDPPSLRSRATGVATELDGIVMKCLQKESRARYGSAGELARDLERWLKGEAVAARPASAVHRLHKWLRRRRNLVLAGGGGAVVALVATVALLAPMIGAERERALGFLRERTEMALDAALRMRRLGAPVKDMEKFARETEDACREAMRLLPHSAEPHYRLGRIYRALMKDDAALEEQNRALKKEPAYAPSLYERVLLTARRYFDRRARLVREAWRRAGERRALEAGGRVAPGGAVSIPGVADLGAADPQVRQMVESVHRDLMALRGGSGALAPGEGECVLAWTALVEERWDEAEQLLAAVRDRNPNLEEVYEALAEVALVRLKLDRALEWLTAGIEVDRGHVRLLVLRGEVKKRIGDALADKGGGPDEHYREALADLAAALKLDPSFEQAWLAQGLVHVSEALQLMRAGRDPADVSRLAMQSLDEAVRLNPASAGARVARAAMYTNLGAYKMMHGRDPAGEIEGAVRDLDEALRLDPLDAGAYDSRGRAYAKLARYLISVKGDAAPALAAGLRDLDQALRLRPAMVAAWLGRGDLRYAWSNVQGRTHEAMETLREAAQDYTEALRLDPGQAGAWQRRSLVQNDLGNILSVQGEDPVSIYELSRSDADQAARLNPEWDLSWVTLASPCLGLANYRLVRNEDPRPDCAAALQALEKALQLNRSNASTWAALGRAHHAQAMYLQRRQDGSAVLQYRKALAAYEEAFRLNPTLEADHRANLADCRQHVVSPADK